MTTNQESVIIEMFRASLASWDWDTWTSTSSSDREEIVAEVCAELGITADIDEVYDLFYDWSAGLTEEDFNN